MSAAADAEGVNLNIIITPMLDMSFQLLAFFVMTYHPSALEGHLDGNLLPPSRIAIKGSKPKEAEPEIPVDVEPDTKDVMTVVVKAVAKGQTVGQRVEGQPTTILLRRPESGGSDEIIADTDMSMDEGMLRLAGVLKKIQSNPAGTKTSINIEADRDLKHGYFIRVYDVCKAAKFQSIGFIPPPGEGAAK